VLALLTIPCAHAQQHSREREALRRAQQQISRLQQDNAALQREKAELEQKLKAAEEAQGKTQRQVSRLRKKAKALQAAEKDKADLQARLGDAEARLRNTTHNWQEQIGNLRRELADLQATLDTTRRESEQSGSQLTARLEGQTQRAQACEDENRRLYGVTMDLIARYKENRGAWEKFLLSEPFTGLKSVEVENLLEDMRDRAAEASVDGRR
jgi:predicted  nucleic acid-binding Zn-ribbon protein